MREYEFTIHPWEPIHNPRERVARFGKTVNASHNSGERIAQFGKMNFRLHFFSFSFCIFVKPHVPLELSYYAYHQRHSC